MSSMLNLKDRGTFLLPELRFSKFRTCGTSSASPAVSTPSEVYKYEKLAKPGAIRLLNLLPGYYDSLLECQMVIVPPGEWSGLKIDTLKSDALDLHKHIKQTISFEAVSYVWGSEDKADMILCNGRKLNITENLAKVLRRLRYRQQSRWLWVDAVCINQDDIQEKNHQVKAMARIFTNSTNTLFCLQADPLFESHAKAVITFYNQIFDAWSRTPEQGPWVYRLFEGPNWEHFIRFFSCEWWRRVWVIQEYGLSVDGVFIYGEEEISRDEVFKVLSSLNTLGPALRVHKTFRQHEDTLNRAYSLIQIYPGRRRSGQRKDFLDVLKCTRMNSATIRHDYVYALLTHPSVRDSHIYAVIVEPDYSKSLSQVYTETAISIMNETRNLQLLASVVHESEDVDPFKTGFPSWAPQWHIRKRCTSLGTLPTIPMDNSNLFSNGIALPKYEIEGKVLKVIGYAVDQVEDLIGYFPRELFEGYDSSGLSVERVVSTAVREIFQRIQNYRSPYEGRIPSDLVHGSTVALAHTLTAGMRNWVGSTVTDQLSAISTEEEDRSHICDFAALMTYGVPRTSDKHSDNFVIRKEIRELKMLSRRGDRPQFLLDMRTALIDRACFVTSIGLLGVGPRFMKKGDLCCILRGFVAPVILRRLDDSQYIFVGECYVHGIRPNALAEYIHTTISQEQEFDLI